MIPKVSVVLPYRNAESTLSAAIQSILNQTYQDFEFLLIDNQSTDSSADVARSFQDKRIHHLIEKNVGVVHAANRGLKQARGAFIARMDADDISESMRLELQLNLLQGEKTIGLVSGLVQSKMKPTEGFQAYLNWVNEVLEPIEIYNSQFVEYPIINPSIMFRSDLVERYGHYKEGDFPEDYEFFLRLMSEGVKMKKVKEVVLKWDDLPTRLTRCSSAYTDKAFNRVKSRYLGQWLKQNNPFHPEVWIWGAGKQARFRSEELKKYGVRINGFIDVSTKSHSKELPVVHFDRLPKTPDRFIVSYVGNRGARSEIRDFMINRGWQEMRDFLLAS